MVEPTVVPRSEHAISRRDIDPDALKVLYRLHEHNYVAYLVGGSVRDLLLNRRPKDFDIGTSAHPHQVKKLFRNCWIIGRRFRLAHVKFGTKTIEVATFRRQVDASDLTPEAEKALDLPGDAPPEPGMLAVDEASGDTLEPEPARRPRRRAEDHLIHRDNTYGTPEEDAFRRDFTVNALFYDIGTFSIIDYAGGLQDLQAGLIRSIGEPEVRFLEDPVRMLRAVVLAARLEFRIDDESLDAIEHHKHEIARSAPPRLLEEYYKILRSGHAAEAFRQLSTTGLLREITPELEDAPDAFWHALEAIDRYREQFESAPEALSNAILAGTLLHPIGLIGRRTRFHADPLERRIELGLLPVARRDVERLQQIFGIMPRILDIDAPFRSQRGLLHRSSLDEALTWLEIHGDRADVVAHWRELQAQRQTHEPSHGHAVAADAPSGPAFGRRRRRRRRGPRRNHGPA
ncbi:MAG TPA: polynucleotide adenylyltransferase PcnB [Vicinamibacterales bacterium]|jgi:poly(A) polymerase|nr:polynucleotide adenylyltransferase PcnB [Vicinamibacterales bacterium]